ncbi:MAG: biotin synthase BioB [Thermoguttaceae bacterium]|jgi:biotin synthase
MPNPQSPIPIATASRDSRWHQLANQVLEGQRLSSDEGLAVLRSNDRELLDLLAAAYRVRHRWFGNRVHLNFLINAKCGACGEDCGYCSQSKVSSARITPYGLAGPDQIFDGARIAALRQAKTYCIVTSGRQPGRRELDVLVEVVPRIKAAFPLKVCVSPGLLGAEDAARLKAAGVDRVNHNLNTSRRFYPSICTTHGYQDRLDTLRAVRLSGMEICSGGIIGMGEEDSDVVDLALELGQLAAEAVPINFLQPIPGTPLAETWRLDPRYCLKVLCLFRLANPRCELRMAAGREVHLRDLQPLGLYPANSMFAGDYLTTKGQSPEADYRMIESLGFEIVVEG